MEQLSYEPNSAKYLNRPERFIFHTELWDDSVLVFHVEQLSYEPNSAKYFNRRELFSFPTAFWDDLGVSVPRGTIFI